MKIRLMGSPQEVESGIQRIKEIFPVISISREYPRDCEKKSVNKILL